MDYGALNSTGRPDPPPAAAAVGGAAPPAGRGRVDIRLWGGGDVSQTFFNCFNLGSLSSNCVFQLTGVPRSQEITPP